MANADYQRGFGVVVDSGSTFSYLPSSMLQKVRSFLTSRVQLETTQGPE